jgi:4-aminobutyrate aminotransferase-like enzyme
MEQQSGLLAEQFRNDPRVQQARELLAAALAEHTARVDGPRPPQSELATSYADLIARLTQARGGSPYFPYLSSGLGRGPWVELADGSVKLDFISGIGVHGLGHSHPLMLQASIDGALQDTIMQGNLQQHPPSIELCERLIGWAKKFGAHLDHCLLSTSGAMANENALKIALHNRAPASRVLALDHCFAGRSIALAALTDRPQYRSGLPLALAVDYIPAFDPRDPAGSTQKAIAALKKYVERYPNQYANLWMELVAGEGGYYPGTTEYFRALCEIAREQKILITFDEVQTFSRLSQPYAFQHFKLDEFADIVTIGKITQVCATLYGEALKPKGPLLSQTFTASSVSIAAGLAMLDALDRENCFGVDGRNMQRHRYFAAKLEQLAEKHPGKISGPWGEGMMMAFTPGQGGNKYAQDFVYSMYHAGLMGFVAGHDPTRIRFLPPPACTTEADIDRACTILDEVLTATSKE